MLKRTRILFVALLAAALVAATGSTISAAQGRATPKGIMALSFDDGPDPNITPKILDQLKARGVKATFFLEGSQVVKYPALVKRIANEGHTIGNHSWDHPDFSTLTYDQAYHQIADTQNAIEAVTGKQPKLIRFPYGVEDDRFFPIMQQFDLWSTLWHWDIPRGFVGDWDCGTSKTEIKKYIKKQAVNQAIVLLHDGGDAAMCKRPSGHWNYLGESINTLKSEGWKFGVVDTSLQASAPNQWTWVKVIDAK